MCLRRGNLIFLCFAVIYNNVRSFNDSNVTISTTEEAITSTLYFTTTAEPVTSTSEPITSTSEPITSTSEPITSTSEPITSASEPIIPTLEPPADLLCVQYETSEASSSWSELYDITTMEEKINSRRVWNYITEDTEYNIFYYNIEDEWIISKGDLDIVDGSVVDNEIIVATCDDENSGTIEPKSCTNWELTDSSKSSSVTIIMTAVEEDCEDTIISTTVVLADSRDDDDSDAKGVMEIGTFGYVGIGVGCGVLLLCFICLIVYKRRGSRNPKPTDQGISLQPYVPTGMGYDTYKQNQTQQKKKKKQKPKEKLSLKKPAPNSVASATAGEEEHDSTANSNNALIDVFEEDEAAVDNTQQIERVGTIDEANNPFLRDGIFNTGATLVDEPTLGSDAMMSAFDE